MSNRISKKMKRLAVATSDWHLDSNTPQYRKPGFVQQHFDKVEQILKFTADQNADLYNAGDIFNGARPSRRFVNKYLKLFHQYSSDINIYACAGQHDQVYHSKDLSDTGLGTLFASGLLQKGAGKNIVTRDWGEDMTVDSHVLIAHFCVTEKPVPFISYSVTAKEFLAQTKARIVVTGDFHSPHYLESNNRLLVNPGTIMRRQSNEIENKPSVYLIDTEEIKIVDQIFLKIQPAEDVFFMSDISKKKKEKKRIQDDARRFDKFMVSVKEGKLESDYDNNINTVVAESDLSEADKKEIDSIRRAAQS